MATIDERLLDPNGEPKISENFNRVLNLMDEACVGIQSITGTIDASNKLTLTFTLTDQSTQTVEGQITPPSAG